jgi:hypothetical protein
MFKKVKADNKNFTTQNDNFWQKQDIGSGENLGTPFNFNIL